MFIYITTNKVYQKNCEKSNIKLLKIEDLIFNSIFAKTVKEIKDGEGKFAEYKVKSCNGSFYLTKTDLVDNYEVVTKDHWNRIAKLDFNSIEEHFKLMNIQLNIELKGSSIFIEYEFLEENYYKLINSKGITNIPRKVWINIKDTKTLNTYRALEMYSHKRNFVKLNLKEQVKEFTEVSDKNIARTINDTVKKMEDIGVEILIEYNNVTNSSRTKYDNCEVAIKYTIEVYEENSIEYAEQLEAEKQEAEENIKEVLHEISKGLPLTNKMISNILNNNNGDVKETIRQINSFTVKYGLNNINVSEIPRRIKELGGYEVINEYFNIKEA